MITSVDPIIRWIRQLIDDQTKTDGRDVFEYNGTDNTFPLSEDFPDITSFTVLRNDTELASTEFTYDSDTNEMDVTLTGSGEALVEEDIIDIRYNYYLKYSDAEIKGYIEGSLLYFTEFRHSKIFEYDTDRDRVVTINGVNPTTAEAHLIALITAVNINPDNVTLRLPEITRTAVQNKSKKEQISEILSRWQRFVGSIEFIEDEDITD